MANKYYRENLRDGTNPTKRKSNIAKIMETFGPKKKDKKEKPKKRMFANMGGGADSGKMGEMKSKLAIAGMKAKDFMGKSTGGLTKRQIERLKEIMKKRRGEKEMIPLAKGGRAALKSGTPNPVNQNIGKMNKTFNRAKSDLNKDGKLSGYEKKRGKAIAQAMKSKKKII